MSTVTTGIASQCMKNSPIAQFLGRHERILKIAMKVLVVLGVIYGAMACFGGQSSQAHAADGPRVGKIHNTWQRITLNMVYNGRREMRLVPACR